MVKNLPASEMTTLTLTLTLTVRNAGSILGSRRSLGGGNGNSLHYSCLENPKDREAERATVHRAAKSWTRLKRLSMLASLALNFDSLNK